MTNFDYTVCSILLILYIIIIVLYIVESSINNFRIYNNIESYISGSNIPKIIHMTCKDKNNMSEFYKQNYSSWEKYHVSNGWDIRLYDDNDLTVFFTEYYPTIYDNIITSYDRIIFKIDIFKILVLNQIGGVYVDMDVECLKPIDDLVKESNSNIIFGYGPYEHNRGLYRNIKLIECAVMISTPNHSFWTNYVIPALKSKTECDKNPVSCTGPVFITNNVDKYNTDNNANDIKVVEPVYFYPINNQMSSRVPTSMIKQTQDMLRTRNFPKESYCVHYFDGSWWNKNSKNKNI